MENPIKMNDLGVPLFSATPISSNGPLMLRFFHCYDMFIRCWLCHVPPLDAPPSPDNLWQSLRRHCSGGSEGGTGGPSITSRKYWGLLECDFIQLSFHKNPNPIIPVSCCEFQGLRQKAIDWPPVTITCRIGQEKRCFRFADVCVHYCHLGIPVKSMAIQGNPQSVIQDPMIWEGSLQGQVEKW